MLHSFKNNCSELQINVLPLCTVILVRKEKKGLYFSPDPSAEFLKRGEIQLYLKVIKKLKNSGDKCTKIPMQAAKNHD